jgi:hypothetical protein
MIPKNSVDFQRIYNPRPENPQNDDTLTSNDYASSLCSFSTVNSLSKDNIDERWVNLELGPVTVDQADTLWKVASGKFQL